VESNKLKPFTHALALGLNRRVSTEGSCKRLFLYLFHCIRTPHVSSAFAWMAWKKTPTSGTPPVCRPALVKRLVKHLVHRWKQGQMYKRINSSCALGAFLYFMLISVNKSIRMLGAGRIETAIYPPLENLCLKEMN